MAKTLIYAAGSSTSVKIGDTDTDLYLQVAKDNVAVDLTAVKSITVKIADSNKNYLKDISISSSNLPDGNQGILVVPLNSDNVNGLTSGDYYFEVWIVTADGDSEIYPDVNVTKFHVFDNVVGGTTVLTTLTMQTFLDKISGVQSNTSNSETALSTANTALSTANTASSNASTALNTANTASSNASTALSTANTALSNLNSGNYLTKDTLSSAPSFSALQTEVNNIKTSTSTSTDYSTSTDTNLLLGTSGILQTVTNASGWNTNIPSFTPTVTTVDSDTSFTVRAWIAPASYDMQVQIGWKDASGNQHYDCGSVISAGTSGYSTRTSTITAGSTIQYISIVFTACQSTASSVSYKEAKLEKGSVATDYLPNPTETLTQTDYARIKAAIVALGGSLS